MAVAVIALGVTLLTGGDDDGGAADTTNAAAETGGNSNGGANKGDAGEDGAQEEANAKAQAEAERLLKERNAAEEMTADERKAQTVAQRFYEILGEERGDQDSTEFDSAGFCELMSEQAREQTIDYARRSSGIDKEWDCESSVELLVLRSKRTGGFKQTRKAKVVAVNAEGDRATATVRFGKGPLTSIPLVKEDGEWMLGASAGGEADGESEKD